MSLIAHYVTPTGSDTWANSTNPATPCSLDTAISSVTAGSWVKVLKGTYTRAASFAFGINGNIDTPIVWQGFASFNPDIPSYNGRTNNSGNLITTNMPVLAFNNTFGITGLYTRNTMDSFVITGAKGTYLFDTSRGDVRILNCSITNDANGASAVCLNLSGVAIYVVNCDITNSNATQSSYAITMTSPALISDCRIKNNSATCDGVVKCAPAAIGATIIRSQLLASTGVGIDYTGQYEAIVDSCTIFKQNVSAVRTSSASLIGFSSFTNNMITDNTVAFTNTAAARQLFSYNNRTRDNTNSDAGFGDWPYYKQITTDTGDYTTDYIDATNGDFRLTGTSPARKVGLGNGDIGACQRAEDYPPINKVQQDTVYDGGNLTGSLLLQVATSDYLVNGSMPRYITATFAIALNTNTTVGVNKSNQVIIPKNGTIAKCFASAKTGPTGADLIMDINYDGSSIWTNQANRIKIASGQTTGIQTVFDKMAIREGHILTIDIDQIGSTIPGRNITVELLILL